MLRQKRPEFGSLEVEVAELEVANFEDKIPKGICKWKLLENFGWNWKRKFSKKWNWKDTVSYVPSMVPSTQRRFVVRADGGVVVR